MLSYVKLVLAIYNVAKWVVTHVERQKWFREGQAEMTREQLESAREEARKSVAIDESGPDNSGVSRSTDKNNRNRKPTG